MELYLSNILEQLPQVQRAMISVLYFSDEEVKGDQIAKSINYRLKNRTIKKRQVADFKNQINEFCVKEKLPFIIGSNGKGYKYIDIENNPEEALKEIESTIKTLNNRAITTLANLKFYKYAKDQISTKMKYERNDSN